MNTRWFVIGALIAAIAQSAALGKIIFDRANLLRNGKEVILQSGMVDPRDLFKGHYVTLNLTISRIPAKNVEVIGDIEASNEVYVSLKPDAENNWWIPDKIYSENPKQSGLTLIKGKVLYAPSSKNSSKSYRIRFPVNRFYAEKERAKELEKVRNSRNLAIVVALNTSGEAAIKGIQVNGELVYIEPIF